MASSGTGTVQYVANTVTYIADSTRKYCSMYPSRISGTYTTRYTTYCSIRLKVKDANHGPKTNIL